MVDHAKLDLAAEVQRRDHGGWQDLDEEPAGKVAGGGGADAADGVELSSWRGRLQNAGGGASPAAAKGTDGFSSLPSAADEEFGLKEGPQ